MKNRKNYTIILGFLGDFVRDGLKYMLGLIFLWIWVYIYSLILWISAGDIRSQQIVSSIRKNIPKKDTIFEIDKVNLRWIGDESIVVFAYEKIDTNIPPEDSKPAERSYPWIYVFSKENSLLNPLRELIFQDSFYKKEFELEVLPTENGPDSEVGAFDRLKFWDVKILTFWEQKAMLFSLVQDSFTNSNTYRYFWILRYSFDQGKIRIEPMISDNYESSTLLSPPDSSYLKNECQKLHQMNNEREHDDACEVLSERKPPNLKIKVKINWETQEVVLTWDFLNPWFWSVYLSQDGAQLRYLNSLQGATDDTCNQCPHDVLIMDYKSFRWDYRLEKLELLRKNAKDYDSKLVDLFEFNK